MPPRFFSAKDSRAREAAVATHPCGQAAGQWKAGQDEVEGPGSLHWLMKAMTAMTYERDDVMK